MIVDDLVTAFGTASITIEADRGFGIDSATIQDALQKGLNKNVLQVIDKRPDNQLMDATLGRLTEGRAVMYSIAKRDKTAIEQFEAWWSVLCNDGTGNLTKNVSQVTDLGVLRFWHWRAVDNLAAFAERFGNAFIVNQLVEFAIK